VTSSGVDLTPLATRMEAIQSSLDKLQAEKQSAQPVLQSTQQSTQQRLTPTPQSSSQQSQQQRSTCSSNSSQWRGGPGQQSPQRDLPPSPGIFARQATSPTPPQPSASRAAVVLAPDLVEGRAEVAMFVDDM